MTVIKEKKRLTIKQILKRFQEINRFQGLVNKDRTCACDKLFSHCETNPLDCRFANYVHDLRDRKTKFILTKLSKLSLVYIITKRLEYRRCRGLVSTDGLCFCTMNDLIKCNGDVDISQCSMTFHYRKFVIHDSKRDSKEVS